MTTRAPAALSEALTATAVLAERFAEEGYRLYLVGGVVRDAVVGRLKAGSDLDCTTDAPPAATRRIVDGVAASVWTQGERYGTIGCVVGARAFEITTHRAERYDECSRKPAVAFGDDVVTDLARRDFTVNAMAVDTVDGTLIDPHGGRDDLAAGVLRTPLDPAVAFGDDPLRMLRAARFIAGEGLVPDQALLAAVRAMGDRLDIVSTERIRDELEKLLLLEDHAAGLAFLSDTGLMRRVLPAPSPLEVAVLSKVVASVAPEPAARWAALFVTSTAAEAGRCLRRMRCSTSLVSEARGLLEALSRLDGAEAAPAAVRRLVYECEAPIDEAVAFARAVAVALGRPRAGIDEFEAVMADLRRSEDLDVGVLPLDGNEVMAALGLAPGPEVGRALDFLRELTFRDGPITKSAATLAVRQWQAADYSAGS